MSRIELCTSLETLLQDFAQIDKNSSCHITGMTLDSRRVESGYLFFALAGQNFHGLDFVDDVFKRGASAVVVEYGEQRLTANYQRKAEKVNCRIIEVRGLAKKVGLIASRYFRNEACELNVIGITGTDGKTSVAQLLASALQFCGYESGVMGTNGWGRFGELNRSNLTTPDSIEVHRQLFELRSLGAQYVCMEVSSHALDQFRVQGVHFRVAVFTNIARDHLDYHGTVEEYAEAKSKLFEMPELNAAVINADDKLGARLISSQSTRLDISSFSIHAPSDYKATNISTSRDGLSFDVCTRSNSVQLESKLLGLFNVYNLLAVFSVLKVLGIADNEIVKALKSIIAVSGRIEKFSAPGSPLVVVDFAHTPQALEAVLKSLQAIRSDKLWCVFGCGGDRDSGKRSIMGGIAEILADEIIITNDNPRTEKPNQIAEDILVGMKDTNGVRVILDRKEAISAAIRDASAGDCVLIAGKGHEEFQIVDMNYLPFSDRAIVKDTLRIHFS